VSPGCGARPPVRPTGEEVTTTAGNEAANPAEILRADDRPMPYLEALRNREFRGVVIAQVASECGDHFARVGVAALVLRVEGSVLLAALAFAVGYLPGLFGAALLAPLADRMPRRRVLLLSDGIRASIVGLLALLAVPGTPLWVFYALLILAELFTAPFDAARAALLPDVFRDPRGYVAGAGLTRFLYQANQVVGLVMAGLVVALVSPRGALIVDAASFLLSFAAILIFVRPRPAPLGEHHSGATGLLRDALDGARIVWSDPACRAIVVIGWTAAIFMIAPEGVALAYAAVQGQSEVWGGVLMASVPAGAAVGAVLVSHTPHETQLRALPLLVMAMCLPMVATAVTPPVAIAAGLWFISGACQGFMATLITTLNVLTPPEYRGRVNGLAAAGFSVATAVAFVLSGWLADLTSPARAVALAGVAGLAFMGLNWAKWPAATLATRVRAAYQAAASPAPAPTPPAAS
jgi:MFS family permease